MNRFAKSSLIALCALVPVSAALAQNAGPPTPEQQAEQAVLTRQGLLKVMGMYMGPLGAMLKNKVPFDATVAAKSATHIEQLGTMIPDVFAFDTRNKTSTKTKAQDGIWTHTADFNAKADDLVKAATALIDAAKAGDKVATLKAANAVGKACGACHDNFRNK
ncbi:MAG TPA: cytochrome c [Steroidobacteraceae bacterium]|nr:cytochrome c [Steroidobacteraceae bacterium]